MLMLICLALSVCWLCTLSRKRFEQILPPFVMGVILVLYGLALWQKMSWFPYISIAAAAAGLPAVAVRCVKTRGRALKDLLACFFTPGLAAFVLLTLLMIPGAMRQIVIVSDDIRFWGIQAHSVFAHDGLVNAVHHLSPRFMTYTPGVQLFQWLGLHAYGEWSEGVAYVMRAVFFIILMLPLARTITWKRVWLLPVFLVLAVILPTVFFGQVYNNLNCDEALGLGFGYCLICIWNTRTDKENARFHMLCAALGMCVLTLVKQSGIAWALIAAVMMLIVKPCRHSGVPRWQAVLTAASPLITLGTWQCFVNIHQLSGGHYAKTLGYVNDIFAGTFSFSEASEGLGRSFVELFWQPVVLSADGQLLRPPMLVWMLLVCLLPLLLSFLQREHRTQLRGMSLWAVISLVAFFIGYAFILITAFNGSDKDANGIWLVVLNCTRYVMPFALGIMLFLLDELLDSACGSSSASRSSAAVFAACFLLLLPCTAWDHLASNLDPAGAVNDTDLFWEIDETNYWRYDLEAPEDAVVLYGMLPGTFNVEHLQYVTAPVKLAIHDNEPLDAETLADMLRRKEITHVFCVDEYNALYEPACELCENGYIEVLSLYEVNWNGDTPVLSWY